MWSAKQGCLAAACAIGAMALAVPKFQGHAKPTTAVRAPTRTVSSTGIELAVSTYTVVASPLTESVTATGSLLAAEGVTLQAEAAGRVTSIHFEEGSHVRKGDLLVKLNDLELRAMRDRASHRRDLAAIRERRIQQLIGKGVARQEEYDVAINERKVQDAEVALIVAQIDKTEIRAPFDGIVGLRHVSEGAFLTTATRIATLQRVTDLKIEFSLAEQYAARVRSGMPLTFTVSGDGDVHSGRIYAVDPQIDIETRTVSVRATCRNSSGRLLPGNFATIQMQLSTLADALLVPATAILMGAGEKSVFVLVDGKARRRAITTGLRFEDRVQILSGLQPGEVIVTSGLQQVREGLPVRSRQTQTHSNSRDGMSFAARPPAT
jgi:membrane fusion protein (multidrug efflux system)